MNSRNHFSKSARVITLLSTLLFSLTPCIPVYADSPAEVITQGTAPLPQAKVVPNFAVVSPNLWRGGQPSAEGFAWLKKQGIKTIVNLRDGKGDIEHERKVAAEMGFKYVSIPLSPLKGVSKNQFESFLSLFKEKNDLPVFVHCRQGRDRCGTMVGAYRMAEESWTTDKTFAEMAKYGFRGYLFGLSSSLNRLAGDLNKTNQNISSSNGAIDSKSANQN